MTPFSPLRTLPSVDATFQLRGAIGHDDLTELSRKLAWLRSVCALKEVQYDLHDLRSLSPAGLTMLVATLRWIKESYGTDPSRSWEAPIEAPVLTARDIRVLLRSGRATAGVQDAIGTLRCEPFTDEDGAERTIEALQLLPAVTASMDTGTAITMRGLLAELCDNVLRHSGVADGVAALHVDETGGTFEFAVADCGIGIARSLARNPAYVGLAEDASIHAAVGPQVTGDPGYGRGLGLFVLHRLAAEYGAELVIRSGTSHITLGASAESVGGQPDFEGTIVCVRGHLSRLLDYAAIDAQLRRPQGLLERTDLGRRSCAQ